MVNYVELSDKLDGVADSANAYDWPSGENLIFLLTNNKRITLLHDISSELVVVTS